MKRTLEIEEPPVTMSPSEGKFIFIIFILFSIALIKGTWLILPHRIFPRVFPYLFEVK